MKRGLRRWLTALAASGLAALADPGPPSSRADTFNPEPFELEQPDGTRFHARLFGNAWVNGQETLDGYTIVQDPQTGYWQYADKASSGELIPSPYTVGRDLPAALLPKLKPDPLAGGTGANGPPGLTAALGAPASGEALAAGPQLGSRPVLVILVEFLDRRAQTTAAAWAQRFFGPSGSVRDYYGAASYGQFLPGAAAESHGSASDGVVGWLLLNRNHPNPGASTGDANKQITRDALIAADPFVNFAQYDTNGDGQISPDELLIVIIVAGNETSFGSACSPSVWGHRWSLFGNVTPPTLDGKVVGGLAYAQFGEMHCTTASPPGQQATIGIMVHELGHLLGLPDLYDTDQSSNGVGSWSVMGGGSWNAVTRAGDSPSLMDPWSKFFLSWVAPTPVTGTLTNQAIPAAATSATAFQFLPGTPTSGEYFLLENRQRTGYDSALPGSGLLIWHIDAAKDSNREECIPGGSPACSASVHYKIAVVQADNGFDLERSADRGDAGDPFPGTTSNRSFTDTTAPSSRLYSGAATGVSVTGISDSGATMTATLALGGSAQPTLSVTPAAQDFGTVTVGTTADRTFTVQNTGGGTLAGSATTAAPYSIVSGGSYSLGAGASQAVTVRFTPTSATSFSGNVSFGVTGGAAVTRLVSGTGQAGSALAVAPGSQDFGTVTVGTTADRVFTVQNTGGGTLAGSATAAGPFSIVSGGSYSLGAGASQTVTVRFSPTTASPASGTVSFSVTGGPSVARGVTGVGAATVSCSLPLAPGVPVSGSLADADCPSLNRPPSKADRYTFSGAAGQSVTITLQAPAPSFVDTYLFLAGPAGTVVAFNDDCVPTSDLSSCITGFVLPATGTYTIEATSFDSTSRGAYTLALTTATLGPALSVTPASQDFGTVTVGTTADRAFTVQNTGSGTLTGSAATAAPFSIASGGSYSLGAGASQAVTVRFGPTAASPASGSVSFSGGGSAVTRAVTGTGAASPSCSGPITPGAPVTGSLADGDCVSLNRPPARADRYTFSAVAGQVATITLQAPSSFVDTYVYLLGPDGTVAFANDDCNYPADLSSCLNGITLPATGGYAIEATSFGDSARGSYTVSLSLSTGPVLSVTPASQDFGTISAGTTADRTFTVQNTGSGTLTGSATTAAPYSVAAGGTYTLAAGASQSVAVRFGPAGAGAFPGTVTFSSSAGPSIARAVTGGAGSIPCSSAPITPAAAATGTLGDTDCEAPNRPGARADRYAFPGTAGQRVTVNMTSPAFDTFVFLVAPSGGVLAFNDDCPGLHTLDSCLGDVPLPSSGTYVLEATAYAAAGRGSYTLSLQIESPAGCAFAVAPISQAVGVAGGTGAVSVTGASGCAWTASSGAAFVTITSGASGSGNGTVAFAMAANAGAARTAALTVAGQTVTLTQAGPAAATDKLGDFVSGLYESILERGPSTGELANWKGYLQANPNSTGASGIIHTFFDGPEYAGRAVTPESHVRLLYALLLGRDPEPAGLAGWEADLLRRFAPALDAFIDSPEFQSRVAGTASRAALDALVGRFYSVVLGRTGAASEIASWSSYVIATGDYRGAAKAFFESAEYNARPRTLADHVTLLYRTFLDREPEAGAGAPWVSYLVQQRGAMADVFIQSPEFQQTFQGLFP